jgi:hypothetical protein
LKEGLDEAQIHVQALKELGIDLNAVGDELQLDGVRLFAEAYQKILRGLQAENETRAGH